MINVVNQNAHPKTVLFEDLHVGDIYKDEDGYICLKTSYKGVDNCIIYGGSEECTWESGFETASAEVTPLEADLVIK